VSRLSASSLLEIDPGTGGTIREINLSKYAYADGIPQMHRMALIGHRLLVQLQRLDPRRKYAPSDYSLAVEVETVTDKVSREVKLMRPNPVTDFKARGGRLYVGEAGAFGKPDGGIEAWDLSTLRPERLVVDERELGGDLVDFEILGERLGAAIVAAPETKLVSFDPTTGRRLPKVVDGKGFTFASLVYDSERGLLYLADRDERRPGIRVFDAKSLEERAQLRWDLVLPPFQMTLTD
jgi:hypothetical protein